MLLIDHHGDYTINIEHITSNAPTLPHAIAYFHDLPAVAVVNGRPDGILPIDAGPRDPHQGARVHDEQGCDTQPVRPREPVLHWHIRHEGDGLRCQPGVQHEEDDVCTTSNNEGDDIRLGEPEHEPEQAEHEKRHIPESPEDQKDQESGDNPCGQVTSAEPPCLQIVAEGEDSELCQVVPSDSDTGDEESDHDPHGCLHGRARGERTPGFLLVLGGDNGSVLAVEVGH